MWSPILFNTYIKLLGEIVRRFGLQCYPYAADTQLYFTLPSDPTGTMETQNWCLGEVKGLMRQDFCWWAPTTGIQVVLGRRFWRLIMSCSLGLLLDPMLLLDVQVTTVVKCAYYQLGLVSQLLNKKDLATVSLVLWSHPWLSKWLLLKMWQKPQLVQSFNWDHHHSHFLEATLVPSQFGWPIPVAGSYL